MIITLASFKGGVAKSTTAIHLAALLQESPISSAGAIILTPFDNFFSSFSTFMTGTVARVGSLAALVICGISYASGEPGAKKMAVGTAIGVGIANMAASCLTWFST